jgi:CheY-like chemotaxis protein
MVITVDFATEILENEKPSHFCPPNHMFRILHLTDDANRHRELLASRPQSFPTSPAGIDFAYTEFVGRERLEEAHQEQWPVNLIIVDWAFSTNEVAVETAQRLLLHDDTLKALVLLPDTEGIDALHSEGKIAESEQLTLLPGRSADAAIWPLVRMLVKQQRTSQSERANRLQLTEALSQQMQELRAFKGKHTALQITFQTAFSSNPVAQAIVERGTLAWLECNEAFSRMTGWQGTPPPWPELIMDSELTQQLCSVGQPDTKPVHRRPTQWPGSTSANLRQVLLSAQPVRHRETDALLLTFDNVTERVEIASRMHQARHLKAVEEMAVGMNHEFNNLMTIACGHISSLLQERDLPQTFRYALLDIRESQRQALAAGRRWMQVNDRLMQASWKSPHELLPHYTGLLTGILGENVQVETDFSGELPDFWADEAMLAELFLHLACTSQEGMPHGGQVLLTARPWSGRNGQQGGFLQIMFHDSAMDETALARPELFQLALANPATCPDSIQRLMQAQRCAARLGGWLECEAQAGQGNTVHIFLPSAPARDLATARLATVLAPELAADNRKVLVVEDEAPVRKILTSMLRHLGFRVVAAQDADEAIQIWQSAPRGSIHALMTDVAMPGGMTGLHLARTLQELQPDLKVVVCSGFTAEQLSRNDSFLACGNYLPKPYDLDDVRRILSQIFPANASVAAEGPEEVVLS